MKIFITLGEIIVLIFLFGLFIYWIGTSFINFLNHILFKKAWAKVDTESPSLLLDRKYEVLCKKHWWNKYYRYEDNTRKYYTDYLYSEAENVVRKIESGEIKI